MSSFAESFPENPALFERANTLQKAFEDLDISTIQKGKAIEDKKSGSEKNKTEGYTNYPQAAVNNAQKVLTWKKDYGQEVKGMTQVGWTRACQIASKKPLSYDTVKRIAQFKRHQKNAAVSDKLKSTPWKDNGHVAWLGWGGTPMINWALGIVKQKEGENIEKALSEDLSDEPKPKVITDLFGNRRVIYIK